MIVLRLAVSLLIVDIAFLDTTIGMRLYRNGKVNTLVSGICLNLLAFFEIIIAFAYFEKRDAAGDGILRYANMPPVVHMIIPVLLTIYVIAVFYREAHLHYNSVTKSSILSGVNAIDTGLMYVMMNGNIVLINRRMERLATAILGRYPYDGNSFWEKIISLEESERCRRIDFTQWPAIMFADGEIWNFQRKFLQDEDRTYYEIIAKNVTALYEEKIDIEKETEKLSDLGTELSRVLRNISEAGNEEELLNYKVRIHDQLGNAILRTRKTLRDEVFDAKNVEEILQVWENTVEAFKHNRVETKPDDRENLNEVYEQAKALGILLSINGKFPSNSSVCVRAVREAMYNSIRHAYANQIVVVSYLAGDGYHITISDDGHVKSKKINEGGGLTSLRHAIEEDGGSLEIEIHDGVVLKIVYPSKLSEE